MVEACWIRPAKNASFLRVSLQSSRACPGKTILLSINTCTVHQQPLPVSRLKKGVFHTRMHRLSRLPAIDQTIKTKFEGRHAAYPNTHLFSHSPSVASPMTSAQCGSRRSSSFAQKTGHSSCRASARSAYRQRPGPPTRPVSRPQHERHERDGCWRRS